MQALYGWNFSSGYLLMLWYLAEPDHQQIKWDSRHVLLKNVYLMYMQINNVFQVMHLAEVQADCCSALWTYSRKVIRLLSFQPGTYSVFIVELWIILTPDEYKNLSPELHEYRNLSQMNDAEFVALIWPKEKLPGINSLQVHMVVWRGTEYYLNCEDVSNDLLIIISFYFF